MVETEITKPASFFILDYGYSENTPTRKGDNLGSTIVFGNYGEAGNCVTITDTLFVPAGIMLKVINLCTGTFKLYVSSKGREVPITHGTVFTGGKTGSTYTIIVKPLDGANKISIPPHTLYCISMLFQLDYVVSPPPTAHIENLLLFSLIVLLRKKLTIC